MKFESELPISIVVPLFNEEQNVSPLYKEVTAALHSMDIEYELLFVDDGSEDGTLAKAIEISRDDDNVVVVELHRNYGQTIAMSTGISLARGEMIVTLDGDLQNDSADIPKLIAKANEGFDIVVGWRHQRKDNLFLRNLPSKAANWLIGFVTGVSLKDNGCSLKVYRSKLIKRLPLYNDMHRFLPVLVSIAGAKIAEVKVNHRARVFGESKYGLNRIYKVLLDLITIRAILSLMSHPSRWFARLAFFPLSLSAALALLLLFNVSGGFAVNSIIVIGFLFFGLGVFLLSLGMICELAYFRSNLVLSELVALTASRVTSNSDDKQAQ